MRKYGEYMRIQDDYKREQGEYIRIQGYIKLQLKIITVSIMY